MTKVKKSNTLILFGTLLLLLSSCRAEGTARRDTEISITTPHKDDKLILPKASAKGQKLAQAARGIVNDQIVYDPAYFVIPYPNGDVPADRGVCTDVVIRTFRKTGIDLQKEVYEDMQAHFGLYPKIWGRKTTDRNIDHRRVPNLMTYFSRKGHTKQITQNAQDYLPGDVVAWSLDKGLTHIGIVSDVPNKEGTQYLIVHNIGRGQVLEDCLFRFTIIGHYRM
ncbi:DUF1287 domain-containing protein [Taibaiella sp. KBW10]|uniref:DUF1287 domain-containing protein n=1 Tax=Taibaiella sp. KBW10 TaxID=2153357 RepID=UPI000F595350|nr:DUF1287 domain-containing protein [Taibaiella sp. KBW10]RQO30589.1 DUF1287 domain-containing protein [Taibaiella sp. KBW10]